MRRRSVNYFKDFEVSFKDSLSSVAEEFNDLNSFFANHKKRADFIKLQNSVILKKFKKESAVISLKFK